jgi:8-oxo-dGTP pyrophosphatase MutT (NUDIX family)
VAAVAGGASFERPRGAVARLRSALATSAGGIVVSANRERPSLVVGMRRRGRDRVTWTLPKGTPHRGETPEETALREVEEETGLAVRILEPVSSIHYEFVQGGSRIEKTVHYFLMAPVGGDLARHDHEFERVRWVPFDEAAGLLTFPTERELVASTFDRVRDLAQAGMFEPAAGPAGTAGAAAEAAGAAG